MNQDIKYRVLASVVGAKAIDELKKSVDSTAKSAKDVSQSFAGAATAAKAFVGAVAASAAFQYVRSIINMGDQLEALSEKTGIAANQLFGFKVAAETANLNLDSLSGGLNKFSRNLGSVASGNREVIAAFAAIGVSVKNSDGSLRASGDVIIDLANKFQTLKDGPEKARLAIALFGKSGADLIPFLNQGGEALSRFSSAFDADFAKRADAFNDSITLLTTKFQILAINAADSLLPALQEISNALLELPTKGDEAVGVFDLIGEAVRLLAIVIQGVGSLVIDTFDLIIANGRGLATNLEFIFSGIGRQISLYFSQAVALAKADLTEARRLQQQADADSLAAIRQRDAEIEKLETGLVARQKARAESTKKFFESLAKNSLLLGEGTVDEIKKRQRDSTASGSSSKTSNVPNISGLGSDAQREADVIARFRSVQREQIESERLKLEQYRLSRAEFEKLTDARRIDLEVAKAGADLSPANRRLLIEEAEAVKAQRLELIELQQAQRESYSVGVIQSLNEYVEAVKDVAGQTKEAFDSAFRGLEDSLVSFVRTGKLSFTDLANSILDDLARIAIRQGITGPLASALGSVFSPGAGTGFSFAGATAGFANGGVMTSRGPVPLNKYANGGIANSPQLALFGEGRTPEAYVPLPDGRSIPVNMKGAGGGDVFNISVNVSDSGSPQVSGGTPNSAGLGKAISQAVQEEIIKQRRPGGLLA